MKNILLIMNTDFGKGNTIGARALPIAIEATKKHSLKIICRDTIKTRLDAQPIFPGAAFVMKVLTAIPIYISQRIKTNNLKTWIFERMLIRKLKKIDIKKIDIVHSWDYFPKAYSFLKKNNHNIKIFQDVPIALPNILKTVKDAKKFWNKKDFKVPEHIIKALRATDTIIAPSPFVKDSLEMAGIRGKITIIPFGVDIKKFKPLKRHTTPFRVAFLGNVNNRKGIPLLIKTWKELNLHNAELHLYGRVYPEVKQHLKDATQYNIIAHGTVNTAVELPKNHIFVFPSLMEGSAKAVYEALACGLPVIATYNAGTVLKDGKEGYIIPIQDSEALKKKIRFFYKNRKAIQSFAANARTLSKKYTWTKYAKKVIKSYTEVQ